MAEPIVTIKQGQLKGLTDTDLDGETYYKFLGIPYAKPPVRHLRFKAPQPAESWTGLRDALKEGDQCLSLNIMTLKMEGSEDCLYLNVYTKELPKAGLSAKPVMVYIHGGGFTMGSASEDDHGAKFLMPEDVVLVTMNYRLGIFGFLSSDDLSLNVPGNAGLKDQTFSLKWVQENIAKFNGDPNNLTIFGTSAGGGAVSFQVLSPTAKGLFHKAIAQSGVALNPWAWGQKNAIQVVEKLGKKVSTDKDALDILMDVSAEELFQASLKIPDETLDASQRRPFGPVIEKPNQTAFITKNPRDMFASGDFNQVPLIHGLTTNEGSVLEFFKDLMSKDIKLSEVGAIWNWSLTDKAKINALVSDFYFKNGETPDSLHELIGDVCFLVGIIEATKLAAKISRSPVYMYVFSYKIPMSKVMLERWGVDSIDNLKGVIHSGEHLFLFSSKLESGVDKDPKVLQERHIGIKKITKMWADFARTGQPHKNWEPVTNVKEVKYFDLCKDSQLKVNPFAERVAFWENILKDGVFDARIKENPIS